jgi:transposase-like protein
MGQPKAPEGRTVPPSVGIGRRRRPKYSDGTRARAITAVLGGASIASVAREIGCSSRTVNDWVNQARVEAAMKNRSAEVVAAGLARPTLGDLVEDLCRAYVGACVAIANLAQSDPEWLRAQSARQLGILAGVLSDKVVIVLGRVLDAQAAEDDRQATRAALDRRVPVTVGADAEGGV